MGTGCMKLREVTMGNIVDPNGSTSFIQLQKGIKRSPKEGYLDSGWGWFYYGCMYLHFSCETWITLVCTNAITMSTNLTFQCTYIRNVVKEVQNGIFSTRKVKDTDKKNRSFILWEVLEWSHCNGRNYGPHYKSQYRRHKLSCIPIVEQSELFCFSIIDWNLTRASTIHPMSNPLPHIRMYRSWPLLEKL